LGNISEPTGTVPAELTTKTNNDNQCKSVMIYPTSRRRKSAASYEGVYLTGWSAGSAKKSSRSLP